MGAYDAILKPLTVLDKRPKYLIQDPRSFLLTIRQHFYILKDRVQGEAVA